jgi:hypothetical protein
MFGGSLITVFSASNYCGLIGNDAAVLDVVSREEWRERTFGPLPWFTRIAASFDRKGKDEVTTSASGFISKQPSLQSSLRIKDALKKPQLTQPQKKLSGSASLSHSLRLTVV